MKQISVKTLDPENCVISGSCSKHGATWWQNKELISNVDYNIETLKKTNIFSFLFSEASKEDIEVRQTFFY